MPVLSFLDSEDTSPLNREDSELLLKCLVADHGEKEFTSEVAEKMPPFALLFWKRLQWTNASLTIPVALFVLSQSRSPGIVVMWAYTMSRLYQKIGRCVNMSDLTNAFPNGFPSKKEQERLWKAQKSWEHNKPGDNMLDDKETWLTISKTGV